MTGRRRLRMPGAGVVTALLLSACGTPAPTSGFTSQGQLKARLDVVAPITLTLTVEADPAAVAGIWPCRRVSPLPVAVRLASGERRPVVAPVMMAESAAAHVVGEARALTRAAVEAARDGDSRRAVELLQLAKAKLVGVDLAQLRTSDRTAVVDLLDQIDQALARAGS